MTSRGAQSLSLPSRNARPPSLPSRCAWPPSLVNITQRYLIYQNFVKKGALGAPMGGEGVGVVRSFTRKMR